ncbi:hypothetical protein [Nocardioides sp. WS12]|uniref:hypothetical protein n=1 Tax=Nocardioides sp. WS12 TaxID=2486272 RepID=UPI00191F8900|nr:hypothetical protein [Nocardioides sp. WS12]
MTHRDDISFSDLPSRGNSGSTNRRYDVPHKYLAGSTGWAVATEWLGRLAATVAIVLMIMVFHTIHKGLVVQDSADKIVTDFHTANDFFADRADMNAPKKVRKQLQALQRVLAQLDDAAALDVRELSAVLPIVDRLLKAGEGDVRIAKQLKEIATILGGSAGELRAIATKADATVSGVDRQLSEALRQVELLNSQLERTTRKLAILPATGDNK